nr:hypothetical protein BaRGS_025009 [Batillaria attramentaria]
MARDLVLNEQQRKAKRKLIEDNRERRRVEEASRGERSESQHQLTDADRNLISATFNAYYNIPVDKLCEFRMLLEGGELGRLNLGPEYKEFMNTVSEIVTFGKYVPGFEKLDYVDPGMRQLFNFAEGLHSLKLDSTEIALLAAVVLLQSDRSGLMDPPHVDEKLDAVLFAFQHYVAEKRPHQAVRWAKILMKVTDIRNVSNRHREQDGDFDVLGLYLHEFV